MSKSTSSSKATSGEFSSSASPTKVVLERVYIDGKTFEEHTVLEEHTVEGAGSFEGTADESSSSEQAAAFTHFSSPAVSARVSSQLAAAQVRDGEGGPITDASGSTWTSKLGREQLQDTIASEFNDALRKEGYSPENAQPEIRQLTEELVTGMLQKRDTESVVALSSAMKAQAEIEASSVLPSMASYTSTTQELLKSERAEGDAQAVATILFSLQQVRDALPDYKNIANPDAQEIVGYLDKSLKEVPDVLPLLVVSQQVRDELTNNSDNSMESSSSTSAQERRSLSKEEMGQVLLANYGQDAQDASSALQQISTASSPQSLALAYENTVKELDALAVSLANRVDTEAAPFPREAVTRLQADILRADADMGRAVEAAFDGSRSLGSQLVDAVKADALIQASSANLGGAEGVELGTDLPGAGGGSKSPDAGVVLDQATVFMIEQAQAQGITVGDVVEARQELRDEAFARGGDPCEIDAAVALEALVVREQALELGDAQMQHAHEAQMEGVLVEEASTQSAFDSTEVSARSANSDAEATAEAEAEMAMGE